MPIRRSIVAGVFLALTVCASAVAPARGQLVVNGGFETPTFTDDFRTYNAGTTALTGWTIDGAGIVHVGTGWQHAAGNHSVELNLFASGGISQTITTVPGQLYLLEFDMAGQPDVGPPNKFIQVFWGGQFVRLFSFDTTGHTFSSMGWVHRSVVLPVPTETATTLRFFGSVPSNVDGGPALDNVRLTPVPEPSTLALLITAPLALCAWRPRRRSAT